MTDTERQLLIEIALVLTDPWSQLSDDRKLRISKALASAEAESRNAIEAAEGK